MTKISPVYNVAGLPPLEILANCSNVCVWFEPQCVTHTHNPGEPFLFPSIAPSITQKESGKKKMKRLYNDGTSMCPTSNVCLGGIDFRSFPKLHISDWPTAAGATGSAGTGAGESLAHSLRFSISLWGINIVCLIIGRI